MQNMQAAEKATRSKCEDTTRNRAQMRNATATTYYQPIALHLIILILKLSRIYPLPRIHWYLLLALHSREMHAHEVYA